MTGSDTPIDGKEPADKTGLPEAHQKAPSVDRLIGTMANSLSSSIIGGLEMPRSREDRSEIAGLANFYRGLTVFCFWLCVLVLPVSVIWFWNELNEYSPELQSPTLLLIASVSSIIVLGATAVLVDIMNNTRKSRAILEEILIALQPDAQDVKESPPK